MKNSVSTVRSDPVRASLASANANSPKGAIDSDSLHYQLYTNDQASHAADYEPLVIAYRNGAAVRLSDMAEVKDSVENLRNAGLSQGKPAVLVILFRQPGANIISTVDNVKAAIPQLMAAMPRDMDLLVELHATWQARSLLAGALMDVEELIRVIESVLACGASAVVPSVTVIPRVPKG